MKVFQTLCATVAMAIWIPVAALPHTLTTLYRFSGSSDGGAPADGVIAASGVLYGTTIVGAAKKNVCYGECGTVFAFDLATGKETVIYRFNGRRGGVGPNRLTDVDGVLYATTDDLLGGMLFSIDTITKTFTDLHSLHRNNPLKGQTPNSTVTVTDGKIFGTTEQGGSYDNDVVFEYLFRDHHWKVLHDFGPGDDGDIPTGAVIHSEMVYGATQLGGGSTNCLSHTGCGTIFLVDPKTGAETILHAFQSSPDGAYPNVVTYANGMLYGSTSGGGTTNNGTLIQTDPTSGATKILYNFPGGVLGSHASSPLTYHAGALYGTTSFFVGQSPQDCNTNGVCGTIFKYDLATGEEKTLYAFDGGENGGVPEGGLTWYEGAFYGTTRIGAHKGCDNYGCGTIFKFVP